MIKSTYNKYVKYITNGVCCTMISYDISEGKYIKNIIFHNGCPAGLEALARSINGMEIKEVIKMFQEIKCGNRDSSCPNELAKSLRNELELIENNPEFNIMLKDYIVKEYDSFVERSKIDLNKYKIILKIKPEIFDELQEEIGEMVESERDIYWFKFKDVEIVPDSYLKDDFVFNSKIL